MTRVHCVLLFVATTLFGCGAQTMTEDRFWQVVKTAKAKASSTEDRIEQLERVLNSLPAVEVFEFQKQYLIASDGAYEWKLWAAA